MRKQQQQKKTSFRSAGSLNSPKTLQNKYCQNVYDNFFQVITNFDFMSNFKRMLYIIIKYVPVKSSF